MGPENSGDPCDVDLFGDLVYRSAGKRGRPPFQRTAENSRKVSMLLACGWNNERIANAIVDPRTGKAISVPTLKRHFRSELQARVGARDRLEARRMMRVWEQAEAGNIGAERLFAQLLERNDQMWMQRKVREEVHEDAPEAEARPVRRGKKETQVEDARSVLSADPLLQPGFLN